MKSKTLNRIFSAQRRKGAEGRLIIRQIIVEQDEF